MMTIIMMIRKSMRAILGSCKNTLTKPISDYNDDDDMIMMTILIMMMMSMRANLGSNKITLMESSSYTGCLF